MSALTQQQAPAQDTVSVSAVAAETAEKKGGDRLGNSTRVARMQNGGGSDPREAFGAAKRGPPRPIPFKTEMEAAFGQDFSDVKAYFPPKGQQAGMDALGASAAVLANEVVFETANPSKAQVAHEMTHIVQNRKSGDGSAGVSSPGQGSETEAASIGENVAAGKPAGAVAEAGGGIQRDEKIPAPVVQGVPQEVVDARTRAATAATAYERAQSDLLGTTGSWNTANWGHYISRTSSNPSMVVDKSWMVGVGTEAVSNLIGEVVVAVSQKAAVAAIQSFCTIGGTMAGGIVGFAIGTVVGLAVGYIAGAIFDVDPTEWAHNAAVNAETLKEAKRKEIVAGATAATAALRGGIDVGVAAIQKSSDVAGIDAVTAKLTAAATSAKAAGGKVAADTSNSLGVAMIQKWGLQHAGDEDNEGAGVTKADWKAATGGSLHNRPDLYLHQTELEWGKTGLKDWYLPGMKTDVGPEGAFNLTADQAKKAHHKMWWWWTGGIADAGKFENWFLNAYRKNTGQSWVSNQEKADIRSQKVKVKCFLDLDVADGSCYVNEWEWTTEFPSVEAMGWLYDGKHSFDTQPD